MRRLRRWRSHYARVIKYDVCSFSCAAMLKRSVYIYYCNMHIHKYMFKTTAVLYIQAVNSDTTPPREKNHQNTQLYSNNNDNYAVLCESQSLLRAVVRELNVYIIHTSRLSYIHTYIYYYYYIYTHNNNNNAFNAKIPNFRHGGS